MTNVRVALKEMQNQLKRELNDLALALNMEIQKGQDTEEAFNRWTTCAYLGGLVR